MRVLDGVAQADFDIPTETFSIELHTGIDTAPLLRAIRKLGYEAELLEQAPPKAGVVTVLREPTSRALGAALARAKARGVPLIVCFGGPFCPLCRRFEETTLGDPRVEEALAGFEFLKIDTDVDPAAATDLDVHGVPDTWALGAGGRVRGRQSGSLTPEAFLAFLERARP